MSQGFEKVRLPRSRPVAFARSGRGAPGGMGPRVGLLVVVGLFLGAACGGGGGAGAPVGDGGLGDASGDGAALTDSDGDTISDLHESWDSQEDTDHDSTPDYLDPDSDDDGISDAIEAGDGDLLTPPVDTDFDGIPDFRDRDSDNDGIADGDEDVNGNGVVDPGETDPRNPDTDGDGVSDLIEAVAGTDPNDADDNPQAHGNFVFLVPYQAPPEPPEDSLRFRTNIRKVDLYFLEDISVSMQAELASVHANMVTVLEDLTCDPGETAASCADDCVATCGDGSCDPGETPLTCPYDCLGTCGDGVCLAGETFDVCPDDCVDTCGDRTCDAAEDPASCPSDCPGTCGDGICHAGEQPAVTACIPDLWSGAGAFGTTSDACPCDEGTSCDPAISGRFVYRNLLDVQDDPAATEAAVPDWCWGQPCWEPGLAATFYTVTGWGSETAVANGYTMPPLPVDEPPGCPAGYRGYPCFRPDSLPIILLIGDEEFKECYLPDGVAQGDCVSARATRMSPRDFPIVAGAVNAIGAKVIGVQGNGGGTELTLDFQTLALQTGSVDPDGAPYVFQGADDNAAQAIADGIRELTATLPLDMSALMVDDPSDAVDAFAAFTDYLEAHHPGTVECVDWTGLDDQSGDGHDDTYLGVPAGTPVCWKIHVKENTTVPATGEIQIFKAYVELWGNGVTQLDVRTVYFVVPPDISGIEIE